MEKILFWLLNIIISSNSIIIAIFFLIGNRIADDATKECPLEFITLALTIILYPVLKAILFYVIPVKKIKYFNEIFSNLISSCDFHRKFLLKIFVMDIIIFIIELMILLIVSKFELLLVPMYGTLYLFWFGGILPSYLVYIWKEELPGGSKDKVVQYKKIPLRYKIKNLIK